MSEIIRFGEFRERSSSMRIDLFENHVEFIDIEMKRMVESGLTENEINENIFSDIISGIGSGFTDIAKDYIIDWVAEKMGVQTHDESGQPTFFYQLIRNVVEKMEWTKIGSYFGKGSCPNWARAIVLGLADTIEEKTLYYILGSLGMQIDERGGLATTLALSIRQGLQNSVNDTKFMKKVEGMISDKLCGVGFGDILKGVTKSDSEKITNQIQSASDENPDILSKVSKTGIMDILNKTIAQ